MVRFLGRRMMMLVFTFFGITVLAFGLIRIVPGDPVLLLLGERGATPEVYAEMKASMGLDKPIVTQYLTYITKALQGDFGQSVVSKTSVAEEFFSRFPATVELGVIALLFAIFFGIPAGMIAASRRNSGFDYSIMGISLIGYSMPIFWWGLILILVFSIGLGWTPVSGRLGVEYDIDPSTGFMLFDTWLGDEGGPEAFFSALRHLILPAVAMGTIPLAVIARMTRSSMLEVLGEDYMRTAKAKGLGPLRIITVHGLRNALIPIVTVIGLMVGSIVTGAILTETIFSWPGIGKWLLASVTARDYPVIQGGILCIATLIIFINMGVDVLYAIVNPKMRR